MGESDVARPFALRHALVTSFSALEANPILDRQEPVVLIPVSAD